MNPISHLRLSLNNLLKVLSQWSNSNLDVGSEAKERNSFDMKVLDFRLLAAEVSKVLL